MRALFIATSAALAFAASCGAVSGQAATQTTLDEPALTCVEVTEDVHGAVTNIEAGLSTQRVTFDGDNYREARDHIGAAAALGAELETHPDERVVGAASELVSELATFRDGFETLVASFGAGEGGNERSQVARTELIDDALSGTHDALERLYQSCPSVRNG